MSLFQKRFRIESTRLRDWDYSTEGLYFVTICTRGKQRYFGEIQQGRNHLSAIGEIAETCWNEIPGHFPNVELDEHVIMPNHIHGIIAISDSGTSPETRHVASLQKAKFGGLTPGSLSKIIQAYKASVTRWCRSNKYSEFAWQSSFFDHIIRNEKALERIRLYIFENPLKWESDEYFE